MLDSVIELVNYLEGPYRWYIIGGVVLLMAAIINQIIFKSLKWIFIFLGAVIIILALLWQLGFIPNLKPF